MESAAGQPQAHSGPAVSCAYLIRHGRPQRAQDRLGGNRYGVDVTGVSPRRARD